jgi:hypothetical protein
MFASLSSVSELKKRLMFDVSSVLLFADRPDRTVPDVDERHLHRQHRLSRLPRYISHHLLCIPVRGNQYILENHESEIVKKINLGICIAPTQPFRAALATESRVCYTGNTADRQTQ